MATRQDDGSNSVTSSNTMMVSPVVTDYNATSLINIDSSLRETVEVTGIDQKFFYALDASGDCYDLLNGFKVSDFSIDTRLAEHDPTLGSVAWASGSGEAAAFKAVIAKAFDNALDDSEPTQKIEKYLANQLKDAFLSAFGKLMPVSNNQAVYTDASGNPISSAANKNDGPETRPVTDYELEALGTVGTVSVTVNTKIDGFSVSVKTNSATVANNLVAQHSVTALESIFHQIPRSTYELYLPAGSNSSAEMLTTDALPLHKGDSIVFVFDIDVQKSGDDVPVINGVQESGSGNSQFNLQLDRRRVSLELQLSSEDIPAEGALQVGEGGGLRVQPAAAGAAYTIGSGNTQSTSSQDANPRVQA
jgi:hypothetical protein